MSEPLFHVESITITWGARFREINRAHVYGEFAAHRHPYRKYWQITHLPSGNNLDNVGGVFDALKGACAGIAAIHPLKTTWAFTEEGELRTGGPLQTRVYELLTLNGGRVGEYTWHSPPENVLNGYSDGAEA